MSWYSVADGLGSNPGTAVRQTEGRQMFSYRAFFDIIVCLPWKRVR